MLGGEVSSALSATVWTEGTAEVTELPDVCSGLPLAVLPAGPPAPRVQFLCHWKEEEVQLSSCSYMHWSEVPAE